MESVVLINPIAVPDDDQARETFLAGWRNAADHLRQQDGFISTTLHASLNPAARFRFVNVAVWASAEQFQRAVSATEFQHLANRLTYPNFPALYQVVAD